MSSPIQDSRRARRRAESRECLLRAARQVMLEEGYERSTIAAIAERADVGFGTFYTHFSSKEDIFQALVDRARELRQTVLEEMLTYVSDPVERIASGAVLLAVLASRDPEFTRFLLEARRRSENPGDEAVLHHLRGLVAEGCAEGEIAVAQPEVGVAAVAGVVIELIRSSAIEKLEPAVAARAVAELSLRVLGLTRSQAEETAGRVLELLAARGWMPADT